MRAWSFCPCSILLLFKKTDVYRFPAVIDPERYILIQVKFEKSLSVAYSQTNGVLFLFKIKKILQ